MWKLNPWDTVVTIWATQNALPTNSQIYVYISNKFFERVMSINMVSFTENSIKSRAKEFGISRDT